MCSPRRGDQCSFFAFFDPGSIGASKSSLKLYFESPNEFQSKNAKKERWSPQRGLRVSPGDLAFPQISDSRVSPPSLEAGFLYVFLCFTSCPMLCAWFPSLISSNFVYHRKAPNWPRVCPSILKLGCVLKFPRSYLHVYVINFTLWAKFIKAPNCTPL